MKSCAIQNTVKGIMGLLCMTLIAGCDGDMPENTANNGKSSPVERPGTTVEELLPEVERLIEKDKNLKMWPTSINKVLSLQSKRIDVNRLERAFSILSSSDVSPSSLRSERGGRTILWSTSHQDIFVDTFQGIVDIKDREDTPVLPKSDVVLENSALLSKATSFLTDLGIEEEEIGEAHVMPLMVTTRIHDEPDSSVNGRTEILGKYVFMHRAIGGIPVSGQRFALYFHNDGTFVHGSGYWAPVNFIESDLSVNINNDSLNRLVAEEISAKGYPIEQADSIAVSTDYVVVPSDEDEIEFVLKLHANASILRSVHGLNGETPINTVNIDLARSI